MVSPCSTESSSSASSGSGRTVMSCRTRAAVIAIVGDSRATDAACADCATMRAGVAPAAATAPAARHPITCHGRTIIPIAPARDEYAQDWDYLSAACRGRVPCARCSRRRALCSASCKPAMMVSASDSRRVGCVQVRVAPWSDVLNNRCNTAGIVVMQDCGTHPGYRFVLGGSIHDPLPAATTKSGRRATSPARHVSDLRVTDR